MTSWDKIIHVGSSLEPKEGQYAMFVGRWQPLHDGHKALFQQVLNRGERVCIAIRDGETNEKNPFTPQEVLEKIELFRIFQMSSPYITLPEIFIKKLLDSFN